MRALKPHTRILGLTAALLAGAMLIGVDDATARGMGGMGGMHGNMSSTRSPALNNTIHPIISSKPGKHDSGDHESRKERKAERKKEREERRAERKREHCKSVTCEKKWGGNPPRQVTGTGTTTGTGKPGTGSTGGTTVGTIGTPSAPGKNPDPVYTSGPSGGTGGNPPPSKTGGPSGLGYNWQHGSFVYGVEGDWSWLGGKPIDGGIEAQTAFGANWVATARGRAGLAVDATLLYLTGGLAFGHLHDSLDNGLAIFNQDSTKVGWTAGLGIEHQLSPNWTAKAEFRYVDFGNSNSSCTSSFNGASCSVAYRGEFGNTLKMGLIGLNYKF